MVQASSVFLLLLPLELGAVMLHMPCLTTKVALAMETSLRSSRTKLHGSIPTIPIMVLSPLLIVRPLRYMGERPLPRPRKPHGTVSTVSQLHRSADIRGVTKHDMALNVTLQTTQVRKQKILRRHEVANFEHNRPEVLVVLGD